MRNTKSALSTLVGMIILFLYVGLIQGQDLSVQSPPSDFTLSPSGKPYLSGVELAKLYEKHTFCYLPSTAGSCSATEEIEARSATQIRIVRSDLAMKKSRLTAPEDVIVNAITSGGSCKIH